MDNLYIHFYHGRNKIDEKLDDWGFDAPFLVGPLNIQWTYGYIKFWGGDEMHHLITQEDLVPIKGKYYGDFGALHEGEDVVMWSYRRN